MTRTRAWLTGLAAWLALGCSGRIADGEAKPAARSGPESALETARRLAQPEPALARALGSSALIATGDAAASTADATDAFVKLPGAADGVVELGNGARVPALAQLRSFGAAHAPLEIEHGVAHYARAVGQADALWLTRGNAVEELLIVREPATEWAFAWQICAASFLGPGRLSASLGLVFSDRKGDDRLRVPPAFALDAQGARRSLTMNWLPDDRGCGRLDFSLDTGGLRFPLLIDPALEAVVWTQKAVDEAGPKARFYHGLAYDPVREVTLLFGGTRRVDLPAYSDTWTWDGSHWRDISSESAPPAGRVLFGLANSSLHCGVVLVAGLSATYYKDALDDAWLWNGSWAPLDLPAPRPRVAGHELSFDSKRQTLVLYGGQADERNFDLWELGASTWTNRGSFAISPDSISDFAFSYDEKAQASLVFGGYPTIFNPTYDSATDDAYTWNGVGWTALDTPRPSARGGVTSAYDSKRQRIVLWGGTVEGIDSDETWEYSDGKFELRGALRAPSPRSDARLAYDSRRDRVVLFGGDSFSAHADTWEYVHYGNRCTVDADCVQGSCVDGVCCVVASCGTCEACSEATGKCGPVLSASDTDSCSGNKTCSAAGKCGSSAGQACTADEECASAHCADGVCCDRACDGVCEACNVPKNEGSCVFVQGSPAHGTCPGSGPCGASCDGSQVSCSFTAEGEDCGTTCSDSVLSAASCDGHGGCRSLAAKSCAGHLRCAGSAACRSQCRDSAQCVAGFECHNHACVEVQARCLDAVTAQGPGGTEPCGSYACFNGACRTNCERSSDCAPGLACDADGACVSIGPSGLVPNGQAGAADIDPTLTTAPGTNPPAAGCACQSARGSRFSAQPWLALGLALGWAVRRRRARP